MTIRLASSLVLALAFLFSPVATVGQEGGLFQALFGSRNVPASNQTKTVSKAKRVEIDLTKQMLYAFEGNRVVLRSRISSGRTGNTPRGRFRAGPYKSEKHYSSLYHNAPMPWSVQVTGNFFIHGFTVVPNYPASKGCIRLPLTGRNPAKRFYKWCDVGTPIWIHY